MKTIKNFITHPLMVVFIIMSIITAGLFAMNEALINTGFYDKNPLQLIDEHYVFEYGDFASGDIEDYFNILDSERLQECTLTLDIPLDEAGRQVPGSYVATWSWKNRWSEEGGVFTIDIVDTIYPRISLNANEVKAKYGVEYDVNSNIVSVIDIIEGDIPYETQGDVNVKKAGTYEVKVIAVDSHGNTSEEAFKVKVPEPSGYTYPIKYSDGSATITITKEWYGSSWNYIAHIQFTNYSRFGTAVGKGVYGGKETTSSAAKRLGALLAVNGCYSAPNLNYRVVRKGVIYNGANTGTWIPAVYSSNNGLLLSAWETGGTPGIAGVTLQTLVDNGLVTDTFNFGPPILVDGVAKGNDTGRAQRTTIGTSGAAGDIWLVVSDGRYNDGVSAGPTYREVAELLASKGCTFAVPLDGGGSSTMVWKGTVLNAARGKQRAVVDFVYFK